MTVEPTAEKDALVHGIDRHTQEHLCGAASGLGTDALAPSMPITCPPCRSVRPNLREGDCWLCTHPVWGPLCSACGCLAHYPPWSAQRATVLPPATCPHRVPFGERCARCDMYDGPADAHVHRPPEKGQADA